MTHDDFDVLRRWAAELGRRVSPTGSVQVHEPIAGHMGVVVDIELARTHAQVVLWPTARMEFRIIARASGVETVEDDLEPADAAELLVVLARVEASIEAVERSG